MDIHKPRTRAHILVAAISIFGWADFALAKNVVVTSVAELEDAVRSGANRILVEPGVYRVTARIDLRDVDLLGQGSVGSGAGVTIVVDDPISPDLAGGPLLSVAGTVRIENIAFEGLASPMSAYIVSTPAGQQGEKHRITIRGCRFVSADWWEDQDPYQSVVLGNLGAHAGTSESPSWDVTFTDNYVQGALYGMVVGNLFSDDPGARVDATIARNEFHCPDTTVLLLGAADGLHGTLTGMSFDNAFYDSGGAGLWISGGMDLAGAGGSFAQVDWKSIGDRFVGDRIGIAVNGGHRHSNEAGPSLGNRVRVKIVKPRFENCWRDGEILGSSTYENLAANAIDPETLGVGSIVEATLEASDFDPIPGRVLVRNHLDDVDLQRSTVPLPGMAPEPSYGNQATLTGSLRGFEAANPGVNPVPESYFGGGNP